MYVNTHEANFICGMSISIKHTIYRKNRKDGDK